MKYKTIRGKSVAECMMQLRKIYGQDAVILKQRSLSTGGLLGSGLFSKKSYEIECMIPEKPSTSINKDAYLPPMPKVNYIELDSKLKTIIAEGKRKASNKTKEGMQQKFLENEMNATMKKSLSLKKPLSKNRNENEGNTAYPSQSNEQRQEAQEEMKEKEVLKQLFPLAQETFEQEREEEIATQPLFIQGNQNLLSASSAEKEETNSHFRHIKKRLNRSQMSPAFASDFLHRLQDSLSNEEKEEYRHVEEKARDNLAKIIRTIPSQAPVRGESRSIMLLGPTGVGKTTSIAKLAARFHIMEKRAVSIYSLDHYRLAATEQLKTYANVMGLDFHVPLTKEAFIESLHRDGAELILVDTSGASYPDKERLAEIKEYVMLCEQEFFMERHLVIAANTNPSLLEKIMLAYENIGFDKLILTKIDETDFIGAFIEIADKFKRPFSFIMDGQNVPENIRDADAKEMASMVLGL